jgi:hypothetical protein
VSGSPAFVKNINKSILTDSFTNPLKSWSHKMMKIVNVALGLKSDYQETFQVILKLNHDEAVRCRDYGLIGNDLDIDAYFSQV